MPLYPLHAESVQASAGIKSIVFDLTPFSKPALIKSVSVTCRTASGAHGWERVSIKGRIEGVTYFPPILVGYCLPVNTGDTARYSFYAWDGARAIDPKSYQNLYVCVVTNEDNVRVTVNIWIESE